MHLTYFEKALLVINFYEFYTSIIPIRLISSWNKISTHEPASNSKCQQLRAFGRMSIYFKGHKIHMIIQSDISPRQGQMRQNLARGICILDSSKIHVFGQETQQTLIAFL